MIDLLIGVIEELMLFLGYHTARVLIPLLTFGRVHVQTENCSQEVNQKHSGLQLDKRVAAVLGFIFWFAVIFFAFNLF